ncbi:uncharacterized protein PAC_02305 [Phialocephala subalpina]|uniref:BTB domain-containing protein n=1 Tax=Phialocephala subalpina TaxID=576137 RepID=A0A1L7WI25_9HELO|nr:uncharacterized protein PAC_02305 [Phialocephala subalpina]
MAVMTRKRKASSVSSDEMNIKPSKSPRIRLVHIPTKSKPAPSFLGEQEIVTIGLESATNAIPVHKNFITHYSPFFAAHFSSSSHLTIEDLKPQTFNIFLSWLYTQKITTPYSRPDINVLISLWLLAGRFLVSKLQNQIIGMIFEKQFSGYIIRETFWEVFERTERGSKIRTFLVDGFVRKMGDLTSRDGNGEKGLGYEWLPREMLEDVLVEIKCNGGVGEQPFLNARDLSSIKNYVRVIVFAPNFGEPPSMAKQDFSSAAPPSSLFHRQAYSTVKLIPPSKLINDPYPILRVPQ